MSADRRSFLAGALAAVVAACTSSRRRASTGSSASPSRAPTDSSASSVSNSQSANPPAAARFVARGDSVRQQVALTFHASGDPVVVQQLLQIFDQRHVAITAFIVGSWLDANPDFAKRITDGGHELANHTYTHPTFLDLDRSSMTNEITRCRDVIMRLTGTGGDYFRTSGTTDGTDDPGATVRQIAGAAGYPVVLGFDVDPSDYADPGATAVTQRTLDAATAGSIVSLHFGHQGTVDAMPSILDGLERRGLTPVTVRTLLSP
jgi:peptidoglycan/xylan/chitin deacetylase (PgdA/CDA1 family)